MKTKFQFHSRLYLGSSIDEKKLGRIKRRLLLHPVLAKVYLLIPSSNPADQLDIIEAKEFRRSYYSGGIYTVIGIASDKSEAYKVVEKIVGDCIRDRRDCNLREYLLC